MDSEPDTSKETNEQQQQSEIRQKNLKPFHRSHFN